MAYLPWSSGLSATVGNNLTNNPEDILNTKRAFASISRYNKPVENGYIDGELVNAIHRFQKDKNLYRDGIMHPGGETETALRNELFSLGKSPPRSTNIRMASAVPAIGQAALMLGPPTIGLISEWLKNKMKLEGEDLNAVDDRSDSSVTTPNPSQNEKPHCEEQYKNDIEQCTKAGSQHGTRAYTGCKACANERYAECRADKPVHQLHYWTSSD